jgi:hypothetical protein
VTSFAWRALAARASTVLAALLIAVIAFLFRFNALGGELGGFDNDDFATLTRVDMLLSGHQPLRDFAEGELRGAWPSLSFELPALAQRVWGHSLLPYASLTVGALAVSAAVVFLLGRVLSRRWIVPLLAAAAVVTSGTNLYNYQKVLPLTLGAAVIYWMLLRPTAVRLGAMAAVTVIAALFRHDYGVYVGVGALAGLIGCQPRPWTIPLRRIAIYGTLAAVLSLPSALWVARHAGIPEYISSVVRSVQVDSATNGPEYGALRLSGLDVESLSSWTYLVYWAMPCAAIAILAARRQSRLKPLDPVFGVGIALVAMTVLVNHFLLRRAGATVHARFGDAIVPMVLLGPWMVSAGAALPSQALRAFTLAGPAVLLGLTCAAFVPIEEIVPTLKTGGFSRSPATVMRRFEQVRHELLTLPSDDWTTMPLSSTLAAARYLAECTAPDDYVLVGLYADQVPYFARRRFAGGQAYFGYSFFRSPADQQRFLDRLRRQSVPIAITALDYEGEISEDYPLVAEHLEMHYRQVGVIEADDKPFVRVWVDADRQPRGVDRVHGFPCYR